MAKQIFSTKIKTLDLISWADIVKIENGKNPLNDIAGLSHELARNFNGKYDFYPTFKYLHKIEFDYCRYFSGSFLKDLMQVMDLNKEQISMHFKEV